MVRKLLPKSSVFSIGLTTIQRLPKESQQQFDATKGDATYPFKGETHTLILDGKTDDVVFSELYKPEENFITDLQQLRGKTEAIVKACKASEDIFGDIQEAEVDLGTRQPWIALPDLDRNAEVIGHTLYPANSGRSHSISVSQSEEGVRLTVSTETPNRSGLSGEETLGHTMAGLFTSDGSIIADYEAIGYQGKKSGL